MIRSTNDARRAKERVLFEMLRWFMLVSILTINAYQAGAQTTPAENERRRASYAAGFHQGSILLRDATRTFQIDADAAAEGLKAALTASRPAYTAAELKSALHLVYGPRHSSATEGTRRAEEGRDFLLKNKTAAGVVALPSGLQYRVIKEGRGARPTPNDTVVVEHRSRLIDGVEFDSSTSHGRPTTMRVGMALRGWSEALQLMPAGSKFEIFVPSSLGYGARGWPPKVPPHAVLVCEIELIEVRKGPARAR